MELLLNVFWFLLALLGIGLWWARRSRASQNRVEPRQLLREAVSLGCVLILLFFAISLTDDLHAVPAIAEESRSSAMADRKSTRLNSSHLVISYAVFCLK